MTPSFPRNGVSGLAGAGLGVAFAPIQGGGAQDTLAFTVGALINFAGMSLLAPVFVPAMARTIAVGMTAREVRRTVTIEGTLVGLVGVGLGIVLGMAGSALLLTRLPDEGLQFTPPWTLLGTVAPGSLALVAASTRVVAGRATSCRPALAAAA